VSERAYEGHLYHQHRTETTWRWLSHSVTASQRWGRSRLVVMAQGDVLQSVVTSSLCHRRERRKTPAAHWMSDSETTWRWLSHSVTESRRAVIAQGDVLLSLSPLHRVTGAKAQGTLYRTEGTRPLGLRQGDGYGSCWWVDGLGSSFGGGFYITRRVFMAG